ncbi:MAG: PepSY domain-containing protein [Betaproteobacteria bacterium]
MKAIRSWSFACLTACLLAAPAFASELAAQVRCTDAPRETWLAEEQVRKLFGADRYAVVKFKISRTNCYEFYAVMHSGTIVEAYYHPVSGRLVKENRIDSAATHPVPAAVRQARIR